MEMIVILTGAALGHLMNNNGRKTINYDVPVSPNNIPSGNGTIYDSNRVKEMDSQERILAGDKYQERMKRMYPNDYQKPKSVYPNQPTQAYANINGYNDTGSAQSNFLSNLNQTLQKDNNFAAFDPVTSHYDPGQVQLLQPLNNNIQFQDQSSGGSLDWPPSLTGQPVKWTHTNMNPYFGKSKNQQGISNENALTLLEKFTGVPSVENQGTYSQKREVLKPFPNNPESPYKANIDQLANRYDRASVAVGSTGQHKYVTPVKASRDLPFNSDTRILPGNIDTMRSIGNQKYSYQPGVTGGQKGSTRGMVMAIPEPRKVSTFHHYQPEDFIPNRSSTTNISQVENPSVRNVVKTLEYSNNYLGPKNDYVKTNSNVSQQANIAFSLNNDNVTKRLDSYQDPFGGKVSNVKSIFQPGGFQLKEGYKGTTVPMLQGHLETTGSYMNTLDTPNATIKDATGVNTVGAINPSGFKDNTGYKFELDGLDLDVTMKGLFSENKYTGQPHQDFGNGIRKQKFDEFATIKETNLFDNTNKGTAKNLIPKHMSYETVYETGKEILRSDRTGPAPKKDPQIKGPAEQIIDMNYDAPRMEKYLGIAGSIIPKDRDRNAFNDSIENDFNPVNFGGKLQSGKYGNGDDAKRLQNILQKEDGAVEGRFNPVLGRDADPSRLGFQAELKKETDKQAHANINKVQTNFNRLAPETIVKENTSNENTRFDVGLRVTNELYPWIKK